jgi:pimeloyl-ACP methyl ester carboxylesterase
MSGPGRDANCVLPDGRVLEYWDGGDPEGRPVVFHPGTPSCRVMGRYGHQAAIAAGVRLLAMSRPGYGGSTSATVASLLATGRATAALAAAVGLQEYAVHGVSGGGPFAVATAVADPGAVRAVGVAGGIGPWRLLNEPSEQDREERGFLSLLDAGDTVGARAGYHNAVARDRGPLVGLDDDARVDAFFAGLLSGPLTRDDAYRVLWAANLDVILNSPDGYVSDNLAWGGPWDVDPSDVVAPTMLWYGEDDDLCPPAHGRWYADRIDNSQLEILPGKGHLDVCDGHWPDVLAGLLRAWT